MTNRIRVLIIYNSQSLSSLTTMLTNEDDIEVIGTADTALEGFEIAEKSIPDIVIWGLSDGLTPAQCSAWLILLQRKIPTIKIITTALVSERNLMRAYILAGTREFLIKPVLGEPLVTSIRRVAQLSKGLPSNGRAEHPPPSF